MEAPSINATDYRSACQLMLHLTKGKVPVPVDVRIGRSTFRITRENVDSFCLGVLFAKDEAWEGMTRGSGESDGLDGSNGK